MVRVAVPVLLRFAAIEARLHDRIVLVLEISTLRHQLMILPVSETRHPY